MDQDRPGRTGGAEGRFVEIVPAADIGRIARADRMEQRDLPEPDRAIAYIGMVGKIDQRIGLPDVT
ncbi:hypothetical protein GCM10020258_48680 [Sphingomonas yabuuchiae]